MELILSDVRRAIRLLALSNDNKLLASYSFDANEVLLHSVETGILIRNIKIKNDILVKILFSPNGYNLVFKYVTCYVDIFSLLTEEIIFTTGLDEVRDIDISPDNELVAIIYSDSVARLIKLKDKQPIIRQFRDCDTFIRFCNNDILITGNDGYIRKWDYYGKLLLKMRSDNYSSESIISFDLNSNHKKLLVGVVARGLGDDLIYFWDLISGLLLKSIIVNIISLDSKFLTSELIIMNGDILDTEREIFCEVNRTRYSGSKIITAKNATIAVRGFFDGKIIISRGSFLPYLKHLEFKFDGSNFSYLSKNFRQIARTFLLCCQRHRKEGQGVLVNLPRDMRQVILIFTSLGPWQ